MDELIDQLRNYKVKSEVMEWTPIVCMKAADEIERLRAENSTLRKMQPVELSGESARSFELALEVSRLQAENAEMEKQLNEFSEFLCHMTGNLLSKTNYTAKDMIAAAEDYQQRICDDCDKVEVIPNDELIDEYQAIQANLDRVTAERDAAIKDIWKAKWISCKYGTGCDFISAITGCPDCAGCGGWEWRGIKKEG